MTQAESLRKRRAAEAAAGRLDILLEIQGNGGSEASGAIPRDAQKLLGVYVRDPAPAKGFPEDRPTYTGPKGCKLHFLPQPGGSGHWLVTLARLHKLIIEDAARTPDYADPESVWQVATSDGFCDVSELRAVCVNSRALLGIREPPEQAAAVEASIARRPPRAKKPPKARRKQSLEELEELVAELVASFAGDEERLLDAVDELLGAVDEVELQEAIMAMVEEQLAAAPRRRKAKGRRAAA
uniref:Uncharacterized protein n=1 Tax=Alexandrium catenella TaxID=2925 RepID=A0A7S1RCJ2_ALECA|mmetsp:Transcript_51163/g.136765  ORF Transcript_51163/g.136765 Transcript_51163/m.136765 type:complete len:240 (+) Transcript_51163:1-720(+)